MRPAANTLSERALCGTRRARSWRFLEVTDCAHDKGQDGGADLRAADLRFTPEEAAAFLTAALGVALPAEAIAALEARSEGWIAALQLAALSVQGRTREQSEDFIVAFTGSNRTTSPVIRWVDAHASPLDLLDELCPQTEMRVAGQGFIGWCPFHDDRAPDERGEPGTPSFYVVHNPRYGWSWRCLSSNCPFSEGPMKHSFRLLQELLRLDVRAAIVAAYARWAVRWERWIRGPAPMKHRASGSAQAMPLTHRHRVRVA